MSAATNELFIFRGVPSRAVSELCILAPQVEFRVGVTVFEQGAEADVALLLIDGKLDVEVVSGGVGRPVGQVLPGEIVGEQALFSRGGRRSANVRAAQNSRALLISWDLLDKAAGNPAMVAIERHLLGTLARRIRRTNQAIQKIWKETGNLEAPEQKRRFADRLRNLFGGGQ